MQYYPIVRNWKKIKRFAETEKLQSILVKDFNKYSMGRWGKPFYRGMLPHDIETCDWVFTKSGRHPEYWKFVKHGACHWIVNFSLHLAMLVEPNKKWRIVTSQEHSTVWDGENTLFDLNFSALGIPAIEAFELAFSNKKQLPIGKKMRVYFAPSSY